ncbi:hypothetical protein Leryth_012092 [Lithospermum erythrorhizon]|nr:hypothetical protein Leryth_012092 [Lithospermum erythrorhizon]
MALLSENLHIDVAIEILLRLPVKSLHRFRCVCRTWNDLIKSPEFISMHVNHSTLALNSHLVLIKRNLVEDNCTSILSFHANDESLDVVSPELQIPYFSYPFMEVLGPCNGIICLTNYMTFVFCNPVTREFSLLPPNSCPCASSPFFCHTKGVGFGFDSSIISDFKLVRIAIHSHKEHGHYHHENRAEIYSLKSKAWRQLDGVLPEVKYTPCFEIFFNDSCHWQAFNGRDHKKFILSFRMSSEKFAEIDLPNNLTNLDEKCTSLEVSNGSLALIAYTDSQLKLEDQYTEIWIMKEYGISESWTKLFKIGPLSGIRCPLSFMKNDVLLLENIEGQLISYSIAKQDTEAFEIYGSSTSLRAMVYKESLLSIE